MFTEILNEEQLNNETAQTRCDNILRCGVIIKDQESQYSGHFIRRMVIRADEQNEYYLEKVNGQWVGLIEMAL